MQERLKKLAQTIRSKNLDGFIVTNAFNILYLTGFKGVSPLEREALLVVTQKGATLITARLYQNEARALASANLNIFIANERSQIHETIKKLLKNAKRVGFEEGDLKYSEYVQFKKLLRGTKLTPSKNLVEDLKVIKSREEIENIETAQIISQKAFEQIAKTIKSGQTEEEIAEKLAAIIKTLGGNGLAFESIIASGPNSGLPHYVTGRRKIKKGEVLLFDFGAKYKNYCADLSRTIFVGKAPDEHKNIYSHVKRAQEKAISKITHHGKASQAFRESYNHFKKHALEEYFLHSLGHGIGLEVHEKPSLSKKSEDTLIEGMVFSVEPGLYFDWGGVRIEDLVAIVSGKPKILGTSANFFEIE